MGQLLLTKLSLSSQQILILFQSVISHQELKISITFVILIAGINSLGANNWQYKIFMWVSVFSALGLTAAVKEGGFNIVKH